MERAATKYNVLIWQVWFKVLSPYSDALTERAKREIADMYSILAVCYSEAE